jgi:hypothetical protein
VVALLDRVFARWDALAAEHGVEKIKTIGHAYMVAGGIPRRRADHTEAIAEMALAMGAEVARLAAETGHALELRIGIDTGSVVAGVIGRTKFSYDLWGDTVNTASRMQSHAPPGPIQVTARTFDRLRNRYELRARGTIEVGQGADAPLAPPRAPLRPRAPDRARRSRARARSHPPSLSTSPAVQRPRSPTVATRHSLTRHRFEPGPHDLGRSAQREPPDLLKSCRCIELLDLRARRGARGRALGERGERDGNDGEGHRRRAAFRRD